LVHELLLVIRLGFLQSQGITGDFGHYPDTSAAGYRRDEEDRQFFGFPTLY
jgi:hypothetical protein